MFGCLSELKWPNSPKVVIGDPTCLLSQTYFDKARKAVRWWTAVLFLTDFRAGWCRNELEIVERNYDGDYKDDGLHFTDTGSGHKNSENFENQFQYYLFTKLVPFISPFYLGVLQMNEPRKIRRRMPICRRRRGAAAQRDRGVYMKSGAIEVC